nr:MAG TPA: hypothetical protein [Bacteriophage sp.]
MYFHIYCILNQLLLHYCFHQNRIYQNTFVVPPFIYKYCTKPVLEWQ